MTVIGASVIRWLSGMMIACALLGRVIVPSGFMIAPAAAGAVPMVVICTGQGSMTVPMAALAGQHDPQTDHDQHQDKANEHPCAFAAASAAVDLTAMLHPAGPVSVATGNIANIRPAAQPGRGLAAPPPPKTGPPLHS